MAAQQGLQILVQNEARHDVPGMGKDEREEPDDPADARFILEGGDEAGKFDLRLLAGRVFGRSRHAPPDDAMYKSAFTTSRRSVLRGRPIRFGSGIRGAIGAYLSSVRSLA